MTPGDELSPTQQSQAEQRIPETLTCEPVNLASARELSSLGCGMIEHATTLTDQPTAGLYDPPKAVELRHTTGGIPIHRVCAHRASAIIGGVQEPQHRAN